MEKWQAICKIMSAPRDSEQALVAAFVEHGLKEVLGWDDGDLNLETWMCLATTVNGRADIILANEVVFEAKAQDLNLDNKVHLEQLDTYVAKLRKKFGVMLSDEMIVFYDDFTNRQSSLQLIGRFRFDEPENTLAGEFIELITQKHLSAAKLEEFCRKNWDGTCMHDLYKIKSAKSRKTQETGELCRAYWQAFLAKYRNADQILGKMTIGCNKDICARRKLVQAILARQGIQLGLLQFGIKRAAQTNERIVEIRFMSSEVMDDCLLPNEDEIIAKINAIGEYVPSKKGAAIGCSFWVNGASQDEEFAQIFSTYKKFQAIILEYLK